jgi:hypothetical protein
VIFADGQFVGAGDHGTFEEFGEKIKGVAEAGNLAKIGAWDQLEALNRASFQIPPPRGENDMVYTFRQLAATHLVQERKFKSDAAASQLAEIYCSLPTLWQWQPPSNPS